MADVLRPELSLAEAHSTPRRVPTSVYVKRSLRHVILIGALVSMPALDPLFRG